jgi:chemotaxis protein CheY-P-specific phosphatase CheC
MALLTTICLMLTLTAGCTSNNDDKSFKSLVEQLNQNDQKIKSTLQNADGSFNKDVMNNLVNSYTDAKDKMVSMKLSDTYTGARDEYVKGLDEAIAGYSALLKTDSNYVIGAYTNAEAAVKQLNTAQGNFDDVKKRLGV